MDTLIVWLREALNSSTLSIMGVAVLSGIIINLLSDRILRLVQSWKEKHDNDRYIIIYHKNGSVKLKLSPDMTKDEARKIATKILGAKDEDAEKMAEQIIAIERKKKS